MINRELIRLKVLQLLYAYNFQPGVQPAIALGEQAYSLKAAYSLYTYMLGFLTEVRALAQTQADLLSKRCAAYGQQLPEQAPELRLAQNQVLLQLADHPQMRLWRERHATPWPGEEEQVRRVYDLFTQSDVMQTYLSRGDFGFEADRELLRKLYKSFVCESDDLQILVEQQSLYWNDDKQVVDSFVLKTIKRFTPADEPAPQAAAEKDSAAPAAASAASVEDYAEMAADDAALAADEELSATPEPPLLPPFDSTDDWHFARRLLRASLEMEESARELIRSGIKNWDYDRLALMDVVIMQMALAEILTFERIPLSVSFNEYLELAKVYSTPRSAGYIHGVLDGVVRRLSAEGRILKPLPPQKPRAAAAGKPVGEKTAQRRERIGQARRERIAPPPGADRQPKPDHANAPDEE